MYYRYKIEGIFINYDKYMGNCERDYIMIFPIGTTEEKAKESFQQMTKDKKHYKNLSLFRKIYIHYEGEEEKIL